MHFTSVPSVREHLSGSKTEWEKFKEDERLEKERPIREAADRLSRAHGELLRAENKKALKELLTYPNQEVASKCPTYAPAEPQTTEQVYAAIEKAYTTFVAEMEERGITIKAGAHNKFGRVCTLNPYIDSRQPESFHAIFEAIDAIDGWTEKEVQKPEPVAEPEPSKPIDPWAAVEAQESVTREGARKARQLFDRAFFKGDVSPLWHEWIASLAEHWNFVPNEEQKKQACGAFEKLNLPFTDKRSYDKVRKHCSAVGIFPPLQTNEEALSAELEEYRVNNPGATAYQERQWFVRRQKELQVHE
jgi:hypothetical protein